MTNQDLTALTRSLHGAWKLRSAQVRLASGGPSRALAPAVQGQLLYDPSGQMSAHVMWPDRPRFARSDPRRGTEAEVRAAFEGYIAYFGRYEVDEASGIVTHVVEGSLFPNWNGTTQIRHVSLEGDRMVMTTPPVTIAGREVVYCFELERA